MNKIALIFIGNIEICPYIKEYERIFRQQKIDYDVLFWRREELNSNYPCNYKFFSFESDVKKRKKDKIYDFMRFYRWLNVMLSKESYTHYVFLDTLSSFLVYFGGKISSVKCLLEIRDYTYEKNPLFKFIEKHIVRQMQAVFISSESFKTFLPKHNYLITHNFNEVEYIKNCNKRQFVKKRKGDRLNVVYTGAIKYFDYQVAILEELKNDSRFKIIYHGIGPDYKKLVEYCNKNKMNNVLFTGLYTERDKNNIYSQADFLINCYDINLGAEIKYAVSNKYYDGLIYHIPQFVESKTYKGQLISENGCGFTWTPEEGKLADKIINFYYNLDEEFFNKECLNLMSKYYKQYIEYTTVITKFAKDL